MQDLVREREFYDRLFARNPENEHITAGYDEVHTLAFTTPPGGLVFDIGCGTGGHAVRLAKRGYRVAAMDLTRQGVKSARERFRREGIEGGLFFVGDAEHLPVRDKVADVAWTSLLLHHFPKLDILPAELARVTRTRVIAFEPNAQNLLTNLAFNWANRYFWFALKKLVRNQRALWPHKLKRVFAAHNFRMGEVHYVDRQWSDKLGLVRRTYVAFTRRLPIRYRANKFLVTFWRQEA